VVEPRVSLQWFVKVETLAKAAGDAVRDGRVKIHPPELAARYFAWVDNMHDWCISRQLWWGHRIPVWYGPSGEAVCVGPDETAPEGWTQDTDVLDTWFSSGLWPFSTLGWPDQTADLKRFYPTSVLVTGYDILFFWVARMMMFGLYAMDGVPPFETIALHGMVRDQHGKKMSKSFGNVVDPLDWIERYGADATRFTLLRGANPGGDVPVAEEWAQGSRNFCNKLWNATRFALMNGATVAGPLPSSPRVADRWILSRLQEVVREVDAQFEAFDFAKACETLYHFAWDEFCDWYVELAKVPLLAGGAPAEATRRVLGEVLDTVLRLLHPFIPFLTEELWLALQGTDDGRSIMVAPWPGGTEESGPYDAEAVAEIASLQRLVTEVRRFRSDQGLKPGQKVTAALSGIEGTPLAAHEEAIRSLLRLTLPGEGFTPTATLPVEGLSVQLDTAGSIDVKAERTRLEKDLAAARKEIDQANRKLGNAEFMAKAPEAVVAKNRDRLAQSEADIQRLELQLAALPPG
jgi:valyl-tRNA synthetase